MEDLKSKYGFSDEQMDDIRELVVSSIKEVIPAVLEESTKILAEKCKESVTNATKNYFPKVNTPPSREAVQFITRNKQSWKVQLADCNTLYGSFFDARVYSTYMVNACKKSQYTFHVDTAVIRFTFCMTRKRVSVLLPIFRICKLIWRS